MSLSSIQELTDDVYNAYWLGSDVTSGWVRLLYFISRSVVLNQGSIEPQGFGESVSGVRWLEIF